VIRIVIFALGLLAALVVGMIIDAFRHPVATSLVMLGAVVAYLYFH
jgi:hypothetical protein